MSNFYIVATPIGNLEDITLRALRILKEVDLILCEDTRTTKALLNKYGISKPTMSYHAQSKLAKIDQIFALLQEGKNLALVSDAGTPTISDPGVKLIREIIKKFEALNPKSEINANVQNSKFQIKIIPIPGPSAVITALSASGLPASEFTFLGFLPHKKGRETIFKEIAESARTVVFYESPHRILKTLESLKKYAPERKITIARELTKIYEEFKTGTADEFLEFYKQNNEKVKGEFVVIVDCH